MERANNMIEETYLKEYHDEGDTIVISFEGNREDIYCLRNYANVINREIDSDIKCADENVEKDMVNKPTHYCSGRIETIQKIESTIEGLPAKQASCLANVLKYFDRAGLKDDAVQDLDKANNYAHRLVYGKWRHEH